MSPRRRKILVPLLVLVAALAATHLRWISDGALLRSRSGAGIRLLGRGLALAPLWQVRVDRVSLEEGRVLHEGTLSFRHPDGSALPGSVSLRYLPPRTMPAWLGEAPAVDAGLAARIAAIAAAAATPSDVQPAVRAALEADGFTVDRLVVDLALPGEEPPPVLADLPIAPQLAPLVVLALDGLDAELIDPMMARGELPTLSRLAGTARGTLEPLKPLISPLLWTSIATGLRPEKHGILDFFEKSGADTVTPVTSASRRVPALWNLFSAAGRTTAVLGWWATFPAEPVRGVVVSDRASAQLFGQAADSLRRPGTIFPPSRAGELERFVVEDRDIPDAELARYLHLEPAVIAERRAAGRSGDPVVQLVRLLASTRTYLGIAGHLLTADRPDALLLYVEGTDTIGHLFAPYHPPRSAWIPAAEFAAYRDAVSTFYRDLDGWLGELLALAPGATVVVMTDHGFAWGADRPREGSDTRLATAAWWHRDRAEFWVSGPGARPGGRGEGTLLDIAPTLLRLLGLPVGDEMPGQALEWAIDRPPVPSVAWARRLPRAPAARVETSREESEAFLANLTALGYLGGGERPAGNAEARVTPRAEMNLGTALMEQGDVAGAVAAFRRAVAADPDDAGAHNKLALALQESGEDAEAMSEFRRGLDLARHDHQREAAWLGLGILLGEAGRLREADETLGRGIAALPGSFILHSTRSGVQQQLGDAEGVLRSLEAAHRIRPDDVKTLNLLGAVYAQRGRVGEAAPLWRRSLELNPQQPQIRQFLALTEAPQ